MSDTLTSQEFESAAEAQDWRVLGWGASAWFATGSYATGAALARRVAENTAMLPDLDIRVDGVKVRIRPRSDAGSLTVRDLELARSVSAAAADLGLQPDPSRLDEVQVTIDTPDAAATQSFWTQVLGYEARGREDIVDPGWRKPPFWLQELGAPRPLRQRIHVDVVRDLDDDGRAALLAGTGREEFSGPFGVMIADDEGNEVDVVPAAGEWDGQDEVSDWRLLFAAMACYPTASAAKAAELTVAVAEIADEAGVPLAIDVRADAVTVDSGKDRWEDDDRYRGLAARVQAAARALGLTADPSRSRFVQLGFDAVDVEAVRAFWRAALRYDEDPRPHLTDLVDPRQLGPTVFFQPMSADDVERREQRNRFHLDVFVPREEMSARVDAALAAGGRVVFDDHAPFWVTIADPEGNELDISTSVGREEAWGFGS